MLNKGSINNFENFIENELNNKKLKELNNELKELILYIAKDKNIKITNNTIIKAENTHKLIKSDIVLEIEKKKIYLSLKSGYGNSIHQETINTFNEYIKTNLNADDYILDYVNWFFRSKSNSSQLKKEHPEKIQALNSFFYEHKYSLLRRFFVEGLNKYNYNNPDFILYRNETNSIYYCNINDFIDYLSSISPKDNKSIFVSNCTLQAWNRKNEKRRGFIQVKLASLFKDLENIHYKYNKR